MEKGQPFLFFHRRRRHLITRNPVCFSIPGGAGNAEEQNGKEVGAGENKMSRTEGKKCSRKKDAEEKNRSAARSFVGD